jgi:hypothetical protein
MKRTLVVTSLLVAMLSAGPGISPVAADTPDLEGQWYGYGGIAGFGGAPISLYFVDTPYGLLALTNIAALGLVDQYLPATVEQNGGETTVTVGVPGFLELGGVVDGVTLDGWIYLVFGDELLIGEWFGEKDTGAVRLPGPAPGPVCDELPPPLCSGDGAYCLELLPFVPESGPGYLNYPLNGETEEDQYRSFATREVLHLVKWAAAKVDCKAADWDYGNFAPIGLGDMSEADGSIPGTSTGNPGHPPGSHEYGLDIDTAYFQLFAPDNLLRAVGEHFNGPFDDAFHLLGEPYALDVWRTALFIAYLSEHPRTRVIGVDGKIGPILEEAFDELVAAGWIEADLRDSIHLAYEVEDTGRGWFLHHHHHLHLSTYPVFDFVASLELHPETLHRASQGQWVTAYIELEEYFDLLGAEFDATLIWPEYVALNVDGNTLIYAEPGPLEIGDFNGNGVSDLMVKFDRRAVLDAIGDGEVEVSLTGVADGWFFQEVDTILVLDE